MSTWAIVLLMIGTFVGGFWLAAILSVSSQNSRCEECYQDRLLAESLADKPAVWGNHDCLVSQTVLPNGELGCPVCGARKEVSNE